MFSNAAHQADGEKMPSNEIFVGLYSLLVNSQNILIM